jgi:hypothetical protein
MILSGNTTFLSLLGLSAVASISVVVSAVARAPGGS